MTTRANMRRLAAITTAAAMAASMVATAQAQERRGGVNRFETAAEVSQATFPSAETVIVSRGRDEFPDALAASYLAGQMQAPILLTDTASLNPETRAEIQRVGGDDVDIIITGRTNAVSAAVEAELDALTSGDVIRLGGSDRYGTAREIANYANQDSEGGSNVGTLGSSGRTAVIATGRDYPDALAGGALTFGASFPMILVRQDSMPDAGWQTLRELDIEYAIVLGRQNAVSDSIIAELDAEGISSTRLGGVNRWETAAEIADFARTQLGYTSDEITLARGDEFPDALAAGPYAGFGEAPILLTANPTTLSGPTTTFLQANANTINTVTAIGGTAAISDAVLQQAYSAAE